MLSTVSGILPSLSGRRTGVLGQQKAEGCPSTLGLIRRRRIILLYVGPEPTIFIITTSSILYLTRI
jgi:hypothetical protein